MNHDHYCPTGHPRSWDPGRRAARARPRPLRPLRADPACDAQQRRVGLAASAGWRGARTWSGWAGTPASTPRRQSPPPNAVTSSTLLVVPPQTPEAVAGGAMAAVAGPTNTMRAPDVLAAASAAVSTPDGDADPTRRHRPHLLTHGVSAWVNSCRSVPARAGGFGRVQEHQQPGQPQPVRNTATAGTGVTAILRTSYPVRRPSRRAFRTCHSRAYRLPPGNSGDTTADPRRSRTASTCASDVDTVNLLTAVRLHGCDGRHGRERHMSSRARQPRPAHILIMLSTPTGHQCLSSQPARTNGPARRCRC
jgi:hypothetical protein